MRWFSREADDVIALSRSGRQAGRCLVEKSQVSTWNRVSWVEWKTTRSNVLLNENQSVMSIIDLLGQ